MAPARGTSLSGPLSTNISALLQSPRKWTSESLDLLKVRLAEDIPAAELTSNYAPKDGDPEFERAAELFCKPTREEIERLMAPAYIPMDNPFFTVFHCFQDLLQDDVEVCPSTFKTFLRHLLIKSMTVTEAAKGMIFQNDMKILFSVPHLLSHGRLRCHGVVVSTSKEIGSSTSIPLIIFSAVKNMNSVENLARYEVPQALLQIIKAYSSNERLDQYNGFVVNLDRTAIRVSRAMVSRGYVDSLCKSQTTTDDMSLYRSASFELLDREDRREFMRVLIGLFRYLAQSESLTMIGDHMRLR